MITTMQFQDTTRERLKKEKRGGENYDATLNRILDEWEKMKVSDV